MPTLTPTVTVTQIFDAFKSKYESKSYEKDRIKSQEYDEEMGTVTDIAETVQMTVDADLEVLVKSIISAVLDEIRKNGLAMGASTAKEMKVG